MTYPQTCSSCKTLNMVDVENLEERKLDKLNATRGYTCQSCGRFQVMMFVTPSLRDAIGKLSGKNKNRPDFPFHFGKVLKKAQGIQKHGPF